MFLLIAILLIFSCSCGVKGPPMAPANSELPSFIKEYNDTFETEAEKEKKKLNDKEST